MLRSSRQLAQQVSRRVDSFRPVLPGNFTGIYTEIAWLSSGASRSRRAGYDVRRVHLEQEDRDDPHTTRSHDDPRAYRQRRRERGKKERSANNRA